MSPSREGLLWIRGVVSVIAAEGKARVPAETSMKTSEDWYPADAGYLENLAFPDFSHKVGPVPQSPPASWIRHRKCCVGHNTLRHGSSHGGQIPHA